MFTFTTESVSLLSEIQYILIDSVIDLQKKRDNQK